MGGRDLCSLYEAARKQAIAIGFQEWAGDIAQETVLVVIENDINSDKFIIQEIFDTVILSNLYLQ